MFLAKVDIAALIVYSVYSVSAGMPGLILLRTGVVEDGAMLSHFVSLFLFLVHVGTVLRVIRRGEQRRRGAVQGERQRT